MQSTDIPSKVPLPFADAGAKNTIPVDSQIGITPGAASLQDGFPPLTLTPLAAGGIPPAGKDFNGIFNLITAVQQWQSAGGLFGYDAAFSTAVGGYPKGAVLANLAGDGCWLNLAENNTTDPDATDGSAANWAAVDAYGIAAITGLTNANVTLLPAQFSKGIITLAGTLTGNVQIIFPTLQQKWVVINNTTGAFTVTCKTASGTGSTVPGLGGVQQFYGDGTNLKSVGLLTQSAADLIYAPIAARVPVGAVFDYAGTSAPAGALVCPTSQTNISRTTYAALFAAIGTTWGAGDGSTTFGMPWFPADYAGLQANGNVGTYTVGQNLIHTHNVGYNNSPISGLTYISAGTSSLSPAANDTGSSGGDANLAAGARVLKCVQYQ